MSRHAGARLRALVVLLLLAVGALGAVAAPAPAQAATAYQYKIINEAKSHAGQPYVYGAAGPTRFDCSGFTMYVFGRAGKRLPHSAAQQYNVVRHIPKASRAAGDLIFFTSSGRITHVGIYAGGNRMWVAPKSGSVVKLQTIYTSSFLVGRI